MPPDTPSNIRPIRWLMLVLMMWGVYLAFGTSRFARDLSDSMWKGAIVIGCVVAFLGLWTAVLAARQVRMVRDRGDERAPKEQGPGRRPWNVPCIASLVLAALAAVCLGARETRFFSATPPVSTALAWAMPLASFAALILAMIGLSDPLRGRGKWLAMLALLAVICLAVGWLYLQSPTAV